MATSVLNYRFPQILPSQVNIRANFEQWQTNITPTNGSEFRSDQSSSVIWQISNPNHFIRTVQSFCDGYIIPCDALGNEVKNAGTKSNYQGVSSCFSRVQFRFSGQELENNENYDIAVNWMYSLLSPGKKRMLQKFEGYGDVDYFAAGKRRFAHALVSALTLTDQALPLPVLAQSGSGFSIECWLKPAHEIFTTANVAFYKIAPRFNYLALTPDIAYTSALVRAVNEGKGIYIHFARPHYFRSNGNGSTQQQVVIPIGQKTSVMSWQLGMYSETDFADRTKDKSLRWSHNNIVGWRLEHNAVYNPNLDYFNYETGGKDLTLTLINLLSQYGNIYNMGDDIDMPADYEEKFFTVGYNFVSQTESAGCGLSTIANPTFTIHTKHSQVVPPSTQILTMVIVEALIQIRGTQIGVTEIF